MMTTSTYHEPTEAEIFAKKNTAPPTAEQEAIAQQFANAAPKHEMLANNSQLEPAMTWLKGYISDNETAVDHLTGEADANQTRETWIDQASASRGADSAAMDQVRAYVAREISRLDSTADPNGSEASGDLLSLKNVLAAMDQREADLANHQFEPSSANKQSADIDAARQDIAAIYGDPDSPAAETETEGAPLDQPNPDRENNLNQINQIDFDNQTRETFRWFSPSDPTSLIGHNTYDDLIKYPETVKQIYDIAKIYQAKIASGQDPQTLYPSLKTDLDKALAGLNGNRDNSGATTTETNGGNFTLAA
jgi:hypothetical protein